MTKSLSQETGILSKRQTISSAVTGSSFCQQVPQIRRKCFALLKKTIIGAPHNYENMSHVAGLLCKCDVIPDDLK